MRRTLPTLSCGREEELPNRSWPAVAVSRLVPSESSWAESWARLEAEMPTTEIMAAIPMAIPRADRKARVGRALMPVPPRRSTSLRRSRERWSRRAGALPARSAADRSRRSVDVVMDDLLLA